MLEGRVVDLVADYFEEKGYLTSREVGVGYGIADLVAYRLNLDNCRIRLQNRQTRALPRVEYYKILRLLPDIQDADGGLSISVLVKHISLSKKYLRDLLLSNLVIWGYVKHLGQQVYAKVDGFIPVSKEVVAIEAKVSDWKKGAIQAKRYTLFANRVFLAIDSRYAHRVNEDLLRRHGIGLISVSAKGATELLHATKTSPRDPDGFAFASESLWNSFNTRKRIKELVKNG